MKIKVTAKRQATFPKQVCESLGVEPGDELVLDRRVDAGQEVWVLRPAKGQNRPWLGHLKAYGKGKTHDMESIRSSIRRGRASSNS